MAMADIAKSLFDREIAKELAKIFASGFGSVRPLPRSAAFIFPVTHDRDIQMGTVGVN